MAAKQITSSMLDKYFQDYKSGTIDRSTLISVFPELSGLGDGFWFALSGWDNSDLLRNSLTNSGYQITTSTSGSGGGGIAPPPGSAVETIDTGNETIISGLPLFNQPLRNLLSSFFTNALATAARDVSQGAQTQDILNLNPADMFGFLSQALQTLGIPQTPGGQQPGGGGQQPPVGPTTPVPQEPGNIPTQPPGGGQQPPYTPPPPSTPINPPVGGGPGGTLPGAPGGPGSIAPPEQPPELPIGPGNYPGYGLSGILSGVVDDTFAAPGGSIPGYPTAPTPILPQQQSPSSGGTTTAPTAPAPPPPIIPSEPISPPTSTAPTIDARTQQTLDAARAIQELISRVSSLPTSTGRTGALGTQPVVSGGETSSIEPATQLFNSLLGGAPTPVQRPTATASIGLGEIALVSQILSGGAGLFGALKGQPEQPSQVVSSNTPYEPTFESPNSLSAFMQLMQLFGPGGGSPFGGSPAMGYKRTNRFGASPAQGTITDPATATTTSNPFDWNSLLTTGASSGGSSGSPLAKNPFTDVLSAFSLPSYQGPLTTPSTPLQQQATDYASEFLRSNPLASPAFGQDTLQELVTTGGRFDTSPQFAALEQITNRRLAEGQARLNEIYGSEGLRYGSDVARGQAGLASELLAQESLQRAQIAQQSFEAATNRRLQALGLAPQQASQQLNFATQAFNLGESQRQAQDQGIQRMMAEFARTQGAFFPLLLQFALAGTEGDTVVLE